MLNPLPMSHKVARKTGLLLLNLGTPKATDLRSMRAYLREFLSDRRVIETNPVLWWFILNGIILNRRPKTSAHAYKKIWNHERNESPLITITRSQCEKLEAALGAKDQLMVDWAMRYGQPAVGDKLQELTDRGCERIVLFPLYPQYSATTTATAFDQIFERMLQLRWQPSLRTVPPYYAHEAYINALGATLQNTVAGLSWKPDRLLISFHGLPQAYHDNGDPYYNHCQTTAQLLRQKLDLTQDFAPVVFQSRFGKAQWLKPYAQEMIENLPAQGVRNLLLISPGFAADCLETLEELALAMRRIFLDNGGQNFAVVPCLNDSAVSIDMLRQIVGEELQGWLKIGNAV